METRLRVVKEDNQITLHYQSEKVKPISYEIKNGLIPLEVVSRIAYVSNQNAHVDFEGLNM